MNKHRLIHARPGLGEMVNDSQEVIGRWLVVSSIVCCNTCILTMVEVYLWVVLGLAFGQDMWSSAGCVPAGGRLFRLLERMCFS